MSSNRIRKAVKIARQDGLRTLVVRGLFFAYRNACETFLDYDLTTRYRMHKFHTKYWVLRNNYLYEAPPEPYDRLYVDAGEIQHKSSPPNSKPRYGLGQIKSGEWDKNRNLTPLSENWVIKGLRQRYQEDKKWEDTLYYERAKARIESDGHMWGYTSIDDFQNKRCRYVDQLYSNIKNTGYRPNYCDINERLRDNYRDQLEVLVVIGRDGSIYHRTQQHRFAIAQILDLEIPVQVICRHKQWQELRDEVYRNRLSEEHEGLRNHPDLQESLSECYSD